MTTLVGAFLEARDELRIHRMRVLLSLVGVAAAVMAMTAVLAIGQMLAQANQEMMERWNGRDTTVSVFVSPSDPEKNSELAASMTEFADRFSIEYYSRTVNSWGEFTTRGGAVSASLFAVDSPYAVLQNLTVVSGSWFGPGDTQRLAPAAVVNETFMRQAGVPLDLSMQPDLRMNTTSGSQSFVVIGVVADRDGEWTEPTIYVPTDAYLATLSEEEAQWTIPNFEMWVAPEVANDAMEVARGYFQPFAGTDGTVDVWSNQGGMGEVDDFMGTFQTVVLAIGTAVLAVGAISLVNISMVTVQQRIREIGIRRAFGATSGRVFFSIMMESVVATFAAGVVGVFLAVVVVTRLPVIEMWLQIPVENTPPFPMQTAILGILIATVIGAISGLIPGIVATRIKPIEAMRAA